MEDAGAVNAARRRQRNGRNEGTASPGELFRQSFDEIFPEPEGGHHTLLRLAASVSIICCLIVINEKQKLIDTITIDELGVVGRIKFLVFMLLWVMPVVTWWSRRYGYRLQALFLIFMSSLGLFLTFISILQD